MYFDSSYRPINATYRFTAYSKFGFEDNEQVQLANLFCKLDRKGHKLMLSNSDTKNSNSDDDFFDMIYSNYNIFRFDAKSSINSNGSKRNSIKEIVVTNY